MENLVLFFYILISVTLIILILLQQGKGSDIGSAFGSGASNTMLGSSSSVSPLTKITAILALIFLILSLGMTWQIRNSTESIKSTLSETFIEEQKEEGTLPDDL